MMMYTFDIIGFIAVIAKFDAGNLMAIPYLLLLINEFFSYIITGVTLIWFFLLVCIEFLKARRIALIKQFKIVIFLSYLTVLFVMRISKIAKAVFKVSQICMWFIL